MQRCYGTYQLSAPDVSLVTDLNKEISFWIRGEAQVITRLVDASWAPPPAKSHIPMVVSVRCEELVKKAQNDVSFYVHSLMNPPPPKPEPSNTINVGNNFGAIQTGANSQAHVHVDMADNAQLIEALQQLRAKFEVAATLTADQRADSVGVVDDVIIAAREPKPNKLKLVGLLNGVAAAVSMLADAPDAWESVRAAASMIGINLL
jgi:hypothetical protein